jgi:hypothetical protein
VPEPSVTRNSLVRSVSTHSSTGPAVITRTNSLAVRLPSDVEVSPYQFPLPPILLCQLTPHPLKQPEHLCGYRGWRGMYPDCRAGSLPNGYAHGDSDEGTPNLTFYRS